MSTPIVIEIDSFTDDTDPEFYDTLSEADVVGVIIKVSQGDRWTLADAPAKVRRATAAGLHVGALHYLEPGRSSMEAERLHLTANLPPATYSLGVVVELDDLGGREYYELAQELGQMIEGLTKASYVPGVRLTSTAWSQIGSGLGGARLWVDEVDGSFVGRAFAIAQPDGSPGSIAPMPGYELVSARMLNRGDTGAQMAPAGQEDAPEHPTEESEGGPGQPESPAPGMADVPPEVPIPETTSSPSPDEHEAELAPEMSPAERAARDSALALLNP